MLKKDLRRIFLKSWARAKHELYFISSCLARVQLVPRMSKKHVSGVQSVGRCPSIFFFCHLVVLESICCCTRANRLTNKSNTMGWLKKNGRVDEAKNLLFSHSYSSPFGVIVQQINGGTGPIFFIHPFVLLLFVSSFAIV